MGKIFPGGVEILSYSLSGGARWLRLFFRCWEVCGTQGRVGWCVVVYVVAVLVGCAGPEQSKDPKACVWACSRAFGVSGGLVVGCLVRGLCGLLCCNVGVVDLELELYHELCLSNVVAFDLVAQSSSFLLALGGSAAVRVSVGGHAF